MPIDPKRILFEDQWLLAVTKLGGELVVKGKGRVDRLPLLDFLRKQYPLLLPIHRLDFETSGVVVFSKTRRVLQAIIASKFAGWKKTYVAVVLGVPPRTEGMVVRPLPSRTGKGMVETQTHYRLLEKLRGCSIVECQFERGQRHQIRKHMSMIESPLILDDEYGDKKANRAFSRLLKMHRFFLHASSVEFPHPVTGAKTRIESPLPTSFQRTLDQLRKR